VPRIEFEALPDDARLWVFGAERGLNPAERTELLAAVDAFLADWRAHGAPLTAARDFRDDRFLMVAVDQASVPPSGCSIDALVNVLKGVEQRLRVALVEHGAIWFRDPAGELRRIDRAGFKRLVEAREVHGDTPVIDTTLTRLSALRAGEWERPARASWHGKAFLRSISR
jgi:hypothetical protein